MGFLFLAIALLVTLSAGTAQSQEGPPEPAPSVDASFTNAQGRTVAFMRDVLEQGPSLVGFTFTQCRKSCPLLAARLDALSDAFRDLPATEQPRIVLISIDPEHDSSQRMRQWASHYRNGSQWTLLTGRREAVSAVGAALMGSMPSTDSHSPLLTYVDTKRGLRRAIYGLASTNDILSEIEQSSGRGARHQRGQLLAQGGGAPAGGTPTPAGTWDRITDWNGVVAVHSVLLPDGRVLYWPRFDATGFNIPSTGNAGSQTPQAWIWDPSKPIGAPNRFVHVPNPNTNLFCAGQALLPDGRLMVIGGHDKAAGGNGDLGVVDVNLFDWTKNLWTQAADMNVERWYATVTPLADGSMMAIGGAYSGVHSDGTPNQSVEIWRKDGFTGFHRIASPTNLARQVVAVRDSGGRADVVMRGIDGRLWLSREQPDHSFPDFAQEPVGAATNLAIRIAAIALPNHGIDVYMVGLDNRMWHSKRLSNGTFPDFANAPVGSPSNRALDIAVVRTSSGKVSAFMVGMDNHLWRSDQAANGIFPDFANQPVASKTNLAKRIAAVVRADDSIELFMVGMDGRMWHSHEQPNGTFPDFANGPVGASTNLAQAIAASRGANDRLSVYMIGMPVTVLNTTINPVWRSDEQPNGSYRDFREHRVGETELSARDVSLAPQKNGGGDVYVVGDTDQNVWRDYQDPQKFGWSELDIPQTTSVTNGWYIYYPWSFVAPNGSIFVASAARRSYWIDLGPNPALRQGPQRSVLRVYGSAVMYEPGKILVLGGARPGATQAESSTEKIDLNLPSPQWTAGAPMNYPRQQATATLLADGQVLVTNGTRSPGEPDASYESPGNAVLPSEIWNPATDTWTVVASSPEARTYHSNALLMPDGRVLVNGGGQGGGGQQPNKNPGVPDHPNADLFSPPYLSGGTRPAILGGGPALIHYQRHFTVLPRKGSQIQAFTLVRLGATTHAFNENQRFVRLSFTSPSPPSFDVVGPANANVAPPGHYLLFAIGTNGVPSMGRVVRVAP